MCQTYSNLEIILVDDDSPDNCPQICDEYARQDNRVKVIHKENGGVGNARNSGMDICSGEFVMFVDSDDYLNNDTVSFLYDRLISDNSDMAIGKHIDIDENGNTNDRFCSFMKDGILSKNEAFSLMGKLVVAPWGKLYRKTVLEGVKYPPLKLGEDLWVFPEIIGHCNKISIVDKVVYYYFQNAEGLSKPKSDSAKSDELEAILKTAHFLWKQNIEENARRFYTKGIWKAVLFDKKTTAVKIFEKYFNSFERKQLLKGQSIKTHLKWMLLHMPIVLTMIQSVKRTREKNKL